MASDPKAIRELIHQENEYTNHRMLWFLALQGFLFTALAFAWQAGIALIAILSVVGCLSSVSVGVLLRFGIEAIADLEREAARGGTGERVMGRGRDATSRAAHALLPWYFLPPLFVLAWVATFVVRASGLA